jgi:hypothetical protein
MEKLWQNAEKVDKHTEWNEVRKAWREEEGVKIHKCML